MKVEQFYNKNQFLIIDKGVKYFQSYNSMIAKIENGTLTLGIDWDYSQTTLKHLYLFINDYLLKYFIDEKIEKAMQSNNKRKALQSLLNNHIYYDECL